MKKLVMTMLVMLGVLVSGCGTIPRTASECRMECAKNHLHLELDLFPDSTYNLLIYEIS